MSSVTQALFVAWRDPVERRYHPVARLARVGEEACPECFEFVYVNGAREAIAKGFLPFRSFPHLDSVYRSAELFPLFANRLMSSSRLDYPAHIERLGLELGADPLDVLGRSGGVRATDSVELFPLPFYSEARGYSSPFFIHALRYMPKEAQLRAERLEVGEQLLLLHDFQNEVDVNALAIRTTDHVLLGYLPGYLIEDAFGLASECSMMDLSVERVNLPPAPLQQRVLCRLDACWPDTFKPFASERYLPIVASAAPICPSAVPTGTL